MIRITQLSEPNLYHATHIEASITGTLDEVVKWLYYRQQIELKETAAHDPASTDAHASNQPGQ